MTRSIEDQGSPAELSLFHLGRHMRRIVALQNAVDDQAVAKRANAEAKSRLNKRAASLSSEAQAWSQLLILKQPADIHDALTQAALVSSELNILRAHDKDPEYYPTAELQKLLDRLDIALRTALCVIATGVGFDLAAVGWGDLPQLAAFDARGA